MTGPHGHRAGLPVSWRFYMSSFKLVVTTAVVVLAAASFLDTKTASAQMTPVGVGLTADTQTVTVGDVFTLTLSVNHPEDYHVVFPDVSSEWNDSDDFEVRSTTHLPTEINDDGTLTSAVRIEAALFRPGVYSTPALSVAVRRPDGSVINRPARPIEIEVVSVLEQGANALKDIRPQAEVPFPAIWPFGRDGAQEELWPWALGGATGLLALMLAVIYFWWRKTMAQTALVSQAPLTPMEAALQELDRIEQRNLPGESRYAEHYALVTDCLRSYLFGQFRIPAPELTSEQAISVLDRRPVAPTDVRDLGGILEEADLVKFARLAPEPHEAREAVKIARRVVTGLTAAPSRFRPASGYTTGRYTR